MATNWKTIKVFISSTFNDMHAERDYLVRFIFPELKERCRKVRVNLIDVDLRWGVSEKDAQEGKALDICLDEIDSCRPYFLGLLGQRYGYIPDNHHHSITAQEIFHGVLHNDLPTQIIDLRSIIDGKLEGKRLSNEQTSALVRCYPWEADKRKYLLIPDLSPAEEGVIRSVFAQYSAYQRDRSFFFFREEELTAELAKDKKDVFFDQDSALKNKLAALKQSIKDEGLPWVEYDGIEVFGQQVLDLLWKRIEAESEAVETEKDWLKEEAEFHELFVADRTRRFVGRRDLLDRMHTFCETAEGPSVMVITGEPGCGKSALMGRFSEGVMHNHPDWLIIPHFIGASPGSTSLRQTLRRICAHLNRSLGNTDEVPEDIKELLKLFPELLTKAADETAEQEALLAAFTFFSKAAEQVRVLIILDAVNQFEKTDNAHSMFWLPQEVPGNVRFVISTLAGEAHDALMWRKNWPDVEEVKGLTGAEIEEFVTGYLQEVKKDFPNPVVAKSFFAKVKSGNPLYIQVALEELRVFGQFEKVAERVNALPDDIPALFEQVLERIEGDFSPALVKDCMSYIACGRQGMTAEELQTLLKEYAPKADAEAVATKLPDMLWARLNRAFSAYLFERSGAIDFFHGQLKEAVGKRYLEEETERDGVHKVLADYFETRWKEPYLRALDELPHQRAKAKDIEGIERVLTDLEFIEAKFTARMAEGLITDYNSIGAGRAKPGPPIVTAKLHGGRYGIFCPFCLATSEVEQNRLDCIVNCPACESWLKVNAFSVGAQWSPAAPKKDLAEGKDCFSFNVQKSLHEFSDFVREHAYFLKSHPDFTFEQAFCQPNHTYPYKKAAKSRKPLLDLVNKSNVPTCILTLKGHTDISSCVHSPDGKRIFSTYNDGTLKAWDVETGEVLFTITTSYGSYFYSGDGRRIVVVESDTIKIFDAETGEERFRNDKTNWTYPYAYSPDGSRIVAVSDNTSISDNTLIHDYTLKIWDVETGKELFTLTTLVDNYSCYCSYSPDGSRIVLFLHYTLKIWDAETGKELFVLNDEIYSYAYSPDGRRIFSASYDSTLKIWDAETGEELFVLKGKGTFRSERECAYSPDGRRIISVSNCENVKVRDAETGEELLVLKCLQNVTTCSYSPDGRRIVSANDETLDLWDAETGEKLLTFKSRNSKYDYSPDGRRIVSASDDRTLKIWDVETRGFFGLKGHTQRLNSCAYSPDGRRIVSASDDCTLKIWDAETGEELFTLKDHKTLPLPSLDLFMSLLLSCSYSPDGRRIVSASYNSLTVWDVEIREKLFVIKGQVGAELSCAYSPDGRRIVSSSLLSSFRAGSIFGKGFINESDIKIFLHKTLKKMSLLQKYIQSIECVMRAHNK